MPWQTPRAGRNCTWQASASGSPCPVSLARAWRTKLHVLRQLLLQAVWGGGPHGTALATPVAMELCACKELLRHAAERSTGVGHSREGLSGEGEGALCSALMLRPPLPPSSLGWHLALQEVLRVHRLAVPDPVSLQPLVDGAQCQGGGLHQGPHLFQRQELP